MSVPGSIRVSFALGLALAAATTVWWLGATRLALEQGGGTVQAASTALFALAIARFCVVAGFGPRAAVVRGWRAATAASAASLLPAWPLVAIAWSASRVALAQLVLVEVALLAAAVVLPAAGAALIRVTPSRALALILASTASVAIAGLGWASRSIWWGPGG